jgi:hypothetical protein
MAAVIIAAVVLAALLCSAPVRRYISGKPLDGRNRTNATWNRAATKQYDPKEDVSRWRWWPGKYRTAVRLGAPLAAAVVLAGLMAATVLTVTVLAGLAAAAAGYGGWQANRWLRAWPHRRHYEWPVRRYLAAMIPNAPVASVTVTRDEDTVTSVAVEWKPEAEIGTQQKEIALEVVTTRLPLEAPDDKWNLRGRHRSVLFTRSEPPPSSVTWDDVAAAVKAAAFNELVFGLGKRDAVVKAAYSESPHLMIPGASGGGKSNLAAFLLLQEMIRGSLIFNLDPKWISHLWLEGLPMVVSAHDPADLHLALTWLGGELPRRTEAVFYSAGGTGRVRGKPGRRIIVLAEELNYGMPDLKAIHAEMRAQDKSLPKESPAVAGLRKLSCAGRASDMHEWLIAQMMTVASTGVSDSTIRGNAGIKAMARYDPPGWAMAVGKHIPMPPQNTTPGRIQVVTGDGVRETQVPYLHLDDKDADVADQAVAWARELAVSGVAAEIPGGDSGVPPQLLPASVLKDAPPSIAAGQGGMSNMTDPPVVTIAEAVSRRIIGPTKGAVRKARSRQDGFPEPVGERPGPGRPALLYNASDLKEWQDRKVLR